MTTKWYSYEDYGSYFRLENDILLQAPMNRDKSMDPSEGSIVEVDLEIFGSEVAPIIEELKKKAN
jgi:hypothetical protein